MQISFKNALQYEAYIQAVAEADPSNTFQQTEIVVQGIRVVFSHADAAQWLQSEFSHSEYKEGFVLRTAPRYCGTVRVFEEPHEGLAWVQAQHALDAGAVVAAIQLYSDKTQLTMKQLSAHPIKMVLLNAPYSARMAIKNITTVGYFPPVEILRPFGYSNVRWRLIKMEIIHACLHVLLSPLKQLSWSGAIMPDPSGQRHNVYPRLLSDVGDDPEVHDHACIFSSSKAQKPCPICECPREQLNRLDKQFPLRTAVIQESRRTAMIAASAGERDALSKKHSQHPVKCGLLGFAGQDLSYSNPYQIFGYDSLHIDNLGIWKNIMEHAKVFMDEAAHPQKKGLKFVRTLSDNLRAMPR